MAKVLVIDDEPDVRTFLAAVLQDHGYEVCLATDGIEGIEVAERERPDLVSLDLMMPNNTGTEFYRRFRKNRALRDTPVIVVSGIAGRHLAVKSAAAIFDKPIDSEQFIEAVRRATG